MSVFTVEAGAVLPVSILPTPRHGVTPIESESDERSVPPTSSSIPGVSSWAGPNVKVPEVFRVDPRNSPKFLMDGLLKEVVVMWPWLRELYE
jgi:hypothetical protein